MTPSRILTLALLPLLLVLAACDTQDGRPPEVSAHARFYPPSGTAAAPTTVTLDGAPSLGPVTTYRWSVDDILVAYGERLTHAFDHPGEYQVTLTVEGPHGQNSTITQTYRLLDPGQALGTDHQLNPSDYAGYPLDLTPEGAWTLDSASAWLTATPDNGPGGPATITLNVDTGKLPADQNLLSTTLTLRDERGATSYSIGTLLPQLAAPNALTIPNQRAGQAVAIGITLANTGEYGLVSSLELDAPEDIAANITPLRATIDPGANQTIALRATCPATPGETRLTINITTNDPRTPMTSLPITLSCLETPTSEFDIQLVFEPGAFTSAQQQMMHAAAQRWQEVIVGDIPDTSDLAEYYHQACLELIGDTHGYLQPELENVTYVDDLLVYVHLEPNPASIPASVLAYAGPCILGNRLPNYGVVTINPAQLAMMTQTASLTDVIIHELGHVLGVGTLWRWNDLIYPTTEHCRNHSLDPDLTLTFEGQLAISQYHGLGGKGHPPTDPSCGHWDENHFKNEALTPYITISPGGNNNPLSCLTIASLADLGYATDCTYADPYALPPAFQAQSLAPDAIHLRLSEPRILTPH